MLVTWGFPDSAGRCPRSPPGAHASQSTEISGWPSSKGPLTFPSLSSSIINFVWELWGQRSLRPPHGLPPLGAPTRIVAGCADEVTVTYGLPHSGIPRGHAPRQSSFCSLVLSNGSAYAAAHTGPLGRACREARATTEPAVYSLSHHRRLMTPAVWVSSFGKGASDQGVAITGRLPHAVAFCAGRNGTTFAYAWNL